MSNTVTPAVGVSKFPMVRFSGFVASYAKTLLASATPEVWAAAEAQIASTLENIREAVLIFDDLLADSDHPFGFRSDADLSEIVRAQAGRGSSRDFFPSDTTK